MKPPVFVLAGLAIGVLSLAATAVAAGSDELRRLSATAHDGATRAAFELERIDDRIDGLPPGARRDEMIKQRRLLEAQLRRELESVLRLSRKIDELERRVVMEAAHGTKIPGPAIEAHPAGPEPVVPDVPEARIPEEPEGGKAISPKVVPPPAD